MAKQEQIDALAYYTHKYVLSDRTDFYLNLNDPKHTERKRSEPNSIRPCFAVSRGMQFLVLMRDDYKRNVCLPAPPLNLTIFILTTFHF